MITTLLTKLQDCEQTAIQIVAEAETAYNAALKARAPIAEVASLDPGRQQIALGEIRTAIAHVQLILAQSAATPPSTK
jgi:hypothetical protein